MRLILRAVAGLALLALAGTAQAQDGLEAAKAAGLVGERADGFAGIVTDGAPADVKALVDRVNAARVARYREIARANGVTPDQVQALAGRKLVEDTPRGQFVQVPGRGWVRK
ncbi:YdbL family protein [Arenibaculum pallidiluteum]|uniref:YdbL family protein n=1 Tax=Arenibaculum pallidiluteum TaxID=2812559 RepID=UPI001A975B4C|nr:YdbL family protein [Arenibaculum pallidiluteum]